MTNPLGYKRNNRCMIKHGLGLLNIENDLKFVLVLRAIYTDLILINFALCI